METPFHHVIYSLDMFSAKIYVLKTWVSQPMLLLEFMVSKRYSLVGGSYATKVMGLNKILKLPPVLYFLFHFLRTNR